MLVLSRKVNETVVIGDNIRVTVVEIAGGKIRLGIEAPRGVSIHREEIHDLIVAAEAKTAPAAKN